MCLAVYKLEIFFMNFGISQLGTIPNNFKEIFYAIKNNKYIFYNGSECLFQNYVWYSSQRSVKTVLAFNI